MTQQQLGQTPPEALPKQPVPLAEFGPGSVLALEAGKQEHESKHSACENSARTRCCYSGELLSLLLLLHLHLCCLLLCPLLRLLRRLLLGELQLLLLQLDQLLLQKPNTAIISSLLHDYKKKNGGESGALKEKHSMPDLS
ncbi:hypothetical protein llap_13208 [Limosa lapponica baueri]|uniref:Uncharacterized protein n=1 Tax=Limosa lapponica baueri TaxID=1758121 RepID=A0A2I0TRR0_LIMLA|nr:hypothetical protein llap_13208 [Limosa lapponica baueri]